MYNTNLLLEEMACELMDLQVFLQDEYSSYEIEGLSAIPLSDGMIELVIHSEVSIPEDSKEEIAPMISSFVPPEPEPEPVVLSNEELTDLVSLMFAKMAEGNMIDVESAMEYSEVLENGMKLSKSNM